MAGSQRDRMLGGQDYLASDPELVAARAQAARLMHRFNGGDPDDGGALRATLVQLLGTLGAGAFIRPPLYVDYGVNISVGARTFMNFGTVILDCATVTIGEDVQIAPGVQLLTATHPLDAARRAAGWESALPIVIGDGAWLGAACIVLPGVSVGPRAVVGAGSVVTRDVAADAVVAGVPATPR